VARGGSPLGFALLGAGAGAEPHAAAVAASTAARHLVVADPDLGRARRLAAPHGVVAVEWNIQLQITLVIPKLIKAPLF
jgi:predicted dehydrogenase